MSDIHVAKGDRVYVSFMDMFGEVMQTTTLGTDAAVVQCDDGSIQALYGDDTDDHVVDTVTGKNGRGKAFTVPTDVRKIGALMLESIGLDAETRASLFQKFLVLDEDVRKEKAAFWEANKDDAQAMAIFLPEMMALLGDDTYFIKAKAAKLLNHLDEDVRAIMFTNMMGTTTAEERKALIVRYTTIQNHKRLLVEFIEEMYKKLLDNKTYIAMEFKEYLSKNVRLMKEIPNIPTFISNASDSQIDAIVDVWRRRKYYRSGRGGRYAFIIVRRFS